MQKSPAMVAKQTTGIPETETPAGQKNTSCTEEMEAKLKMLRFCASINTSLITKSGFFVRLFAKLSMHQRHLY